MRVTYPRNQLLDAMRSLPRNLQRPPLFELLRTVSLAQRPDLISLDINDVELYRAIIAALVARKLT